jgi:hypothetical protein
MVGSNPKQLANHVASLWKMVVQATDGNEELAAQVIVHAATTGKMRATTTEFLAAKGFCHLEAHDREVEVATLKTMKKQMMQRTVVSQANSGASFAATERARLATFHNYNPETDRHEPRTLGDADGAPKLPSTASERATRNRFRKVADGVGVSAVESSNGKCVSGYDIESLVVGEAKRREENNEGKAFEIKLTCDAHGGQRSKKMSHWCATLVNVDLASNSPLSLFHLRSWEGGDQRSDLIKYSQDILTYVSNLYANKGVLTSGSSSTLDRFVKAHVKLCGDLAHRAAMLGLGDGIFGSNSPCPYCECPKDQLATSKKFELRTYKRLCASAHLPEDPNNFEAFTCPQCQQHFPTERSVLGDEGRGFCTKVHKQSQFHVRPLTCIEPMDQPPCRLHWVMAQVRTLWSRCIAPYINTDEQADMLIAFLRTIGVIVDLAKVKKGLKIEAAKLPTLPGKQTAAVLANFDSCLGVVLILKDADRNDKEIKDRFTRCSQACDAVLALNNHLASRPIAESGHEPGTAAHAAVREKAAQKADLLSALHRAKMVKAVGSGCMTSYNCVQTHWGAIMRRCLHDATDYSSEGQEHFGKLIKQAVRLSNQKLYKDTDKTKSGKAKVGYVQQAVSRLVVKQVARKSIPTRPTKRHRDIDAEGRKPRLITKAEKEHAPNRRSKQA